MSETGNGNILVVDDTPQTLQLLVGILSGANYTVRPADSGALALASVLAYPPELVLLDVNMPEMSGFEVCRQLKQNPATQAIATAPELVPPLAPPAPPASAPL